MSPSAEDPYAAIARFYDLEYGARQEDVDFYLNLARRTGGPILDGGAGTGRVAFPLARAGFAVVALESSPAMLALARRRRRGRLARRLRLMEGDLRGFQAPERFALAILAHNTFGHLAAREEQQQALQCIHQHMEESGVLALALQNPHALALNPPQGEVVRVWESLGPRPGEHTAKYVANQADVAAQLLQVRLWYDVVAADGSLRRFGAGFPLRWSYRRELELLLEGCGFQVEHCYGDYNLQPYESHSPLLLVVATKI